MLTNTYATIMSTLFPTETLEFFSTIINYKKFWNVQLFSIIINHNKNYYNNKNSSVKVSQFLAALEEMSSSHGSNVTPTNGTAAPPPSYYPSTPPSSPAAASTNPPAAQPQVVYTYAPQQQPPQSQPVGQPYYVAGGQQPSATTTMPTVVAVPVYADYSGTYVVPPAQQQQAGGYIYGPGAPAQQPAMPSAATAYPTGFVGAVYMTDVSDHLVSTYNLARNIKFLALIDGTFLVILSIFNFFWFLFIWGPICGYYGSMKYRVSLVNVYLFYWVLRIIGDLILSVLGYWWYIIALILDIYIARYVWYLSRILRTLSSEEVVRLASGDLSGLQQSLR
jgi:cytoskeletal protein RodZ